MLTRGGSQQDGATPLWIAAQGGKQAVAQVLLEAGANTKAKDKVRAKRG